MSRPKGSKNKPKQEKTSKRTVREETTFVGEGADGAQPIKLLQEVDRYTFRNIGRAMYWVQPKHSKTEPKDLSPGETRDDFTTKDREMILDSSLYQEGQVIEVFADEIEDSHSPNSLNDKQLEKLLMLDNEEIKEYILSMDSIFALNRVKEKIMDQELPAHLTAYIDSRIIELKAQYEEENRAPIDTSIGERSVV